MRKIINLIEGCETVSEAADAAIGADFDIYKEIEREFQNADLKLRMRRHVEDVYMLCIDGIPFEDSVGHIAKARGVDPLDLRAACVEDYKILRGQFSTYASPDGMKLVSMLNPIIRESFELAEQALMEKSLRVGAYTNRGGGQINILRAEHDPKHHLFANEKGEVMGSFHGTPDEVHAKLSGEGFTGMIQGRSE
jgi:hypothetical protein